MSQVPGSDSLRSQVLRGGAYLGFRQLVGLLINVVGVLLLTRALGPAAYGRYAAALGLFGALQLGAQLGIGVFLVRSERPIERDGLDVAASLLALSGVVALVVGALLAFWFDQWTRIEGVSSTALALLIALPLINVAQVATAQLDRALDYKRVAWIELASQAMFFSVSVPLALAGLGSWAAVAGWWCQQIGLLVGTSWAARYVPRPAWQPVLAREMLSYGFSYSLSIWIYQLRRLANPLVVGRYLGVEAVGIVSLATQIVTQLGFAGVIAWRVSTASLARVQSSADRLVRAITDGMWLQALVVGPVLVLFAWVGPALLPLLLGRSWEPLATVYPFLALSFMANAMFALHSSALYVVRRNLDVGIVHFVQLVLLFGVAAAVVPRAGLVGYGVAEAATIVSYPLMHLFVRRRMGKPSYGRALAVTLSFSVALFFDSLGWVSGLGVLVLACVLPSWPETQRLVADLRSAVAAS